MAAFALLAAAKVANVYVPLVYGRAVDALAPKHSPVAVPIALIAAYGLLRVGSAGFAWKLHRACDRALSSA